MTRTQKSEPTTTVQRETPDQSDVASFLAKADERSASLYPAESRNGPPLSALLSPSVRFFVARQEGYALGCGGYALLGEGTAELKRLFVDPVARGRGVGMAIVRTIEETATAEGILRLFLETGIKSIEALRLYKRLGFTECGPFAAYRPDPLSVFMTKPLPSSSNS